MSKYSRYTRYSPRGPNFGPFRSTTSRFRDARLPPKIGECTESELTMTLNTWRSKVPLNTQYLPNFDSFRTTTCRFRDKGCRKLEKKRWMISGWPWTFTLYAQSTYLWGPHFAPFSSTPRNTRLLIIGNVPNDPRLTWEHLTVKRDLYTSNYLPQSATFGLFSSMTSNFRDKFGCRNWEKSEIHWMTSEWP